MDFIIRKREIVFGSGRVKRKTDDNRITLITCVAGQREKRLCVQAVESLDGMNYGQ